jgi:hypothetical protein
MNELIDENRALRKRIAVLEAHIHGGIHCAFFCALPECAKNLSGETDDTNATRTPCTEAVERAKCSTGNQPF